MWHYCQTRERVVLSAHPLLPAQHTYHLPIKYIHWSGTTYIVLCFPSKRFLFRSAGAFLWGKGQCIVQTRPEGRVLLPSSSLFCNAATWLIFTPAHRQSPSLTPKQNFRCCLLLFKACWHNLVVNFKTVSRVQGIRYSGFKKYLNN